MGNRILIVDYDSSWPDSFAELQHALSNGLGEATLAIEHVGSTSVPGLAAKPILDIDVVIAASGGGGENAPLRDAISRLARLGYEHQGDLGIAGRHSFRGLGRDVPRDGSERHWPMHNLYVSAIDNNELARHLAFRDYLRANSDWAAKYGALKRELAERFGEDRDGYSNAKTAFVEAVLERASTR